jgi:catechol 2,3-dioxygenase-like lactoylglutathione lyase family enzyme
MTPFGEAAAQSSLSGELGVHSLDHFGLSVPDLGEAWRFYTAFGLELRTDGSLTAMHTVGSTQRWGLLLEGNPKRLHHLSFGVFEEDLERFQKRLEELGVKRLDQPSGLGGGGLWIRDPDGTLLELRVAPKSSPNQKTSVQLISSPAGHPGAPKRSQAQRVKPSRLSHCLTFTRNVSEAISFYSRVLGLRLSDRSGDDIAFMHGIHGSDHHLVAFARSPAPGLHHCCWDVRSPHEIGLGAMHMADQGYAQGWGLGRHVLGSNYFHYVRDPWGSHCEYSCDMDYIPAGQLWRPADHPGEDAFYVWGPKPPADWTHNHEADQG